MTTLLSITAQPNTPIACDMTDAEDTIASRLLEYRRLFEHALLSRTSTDTSTTFRFAPRPGVQDWVLDLVRREAACCPFLSYTVELEEEQIVWTTSGGLGASDIALVDEFIAAATTATDSVAVAEQLAARSGVPVIAPPGDR